MLRIEPEKNRRENSMELMEAIKNRHSVRSYTERKIEGTAKKELEKFIQECNKEGNLHMQLVLDEPKAFEGFLAHYGKFSGVRNYIAVVAPKTADSMEKCGYYGEKVVLKAQQLGLNTCWVALTYSKTKSAYSVAEGEKLFAVISVGYGSTQGVAHKSKPLEAVCEENKSYPKWFTDGVNAALYAPTAMNQQKFKFSLEGNVVTAKAGLGFYSKIDLGIVKYHFEAGAGIQNFRWAK